VVVGRNMTGQALYQAGVIDIGIRPAVGGVAVRALAGEVADGGGVAGEAIGITGVVEGQAHPTVGVMAA